MQIITPAYAQTAAAIGGFSIGTLVPPLLIFAGIIWYGFVVRGRILRGREKRDAKRQAQMLSATSNIAVKVYEGRHAEAMAAYEVDVQLMAAQGFVPISQSWTPGSYTGGQFLVAIVLCVVLIGLLVFVYMLIVKPPGRLTVTYEWRGVLR